MKHQWQKRIEGDVCKRCGGVRTIEDRVTRSSKGWEVVDDTYNTTVEVFDTETTTIVVVRGTGGASMSLTKCPGAK